ncbi:hypothetical protein BC2230_60485 [Burkholderia cepacia]
MLGPFPACAARAPPFGAARLVPEFGKRAHGSYNRQNRTTIRFNRACVAGQREFEQPYRRPPSGRPAGGRQWQ